MLALLALAVMQLPAGVTSVNQEIRLKAGDRLEGHPDGSVVRAGAKFTGRALVVAASGATIANVTLEGNGAASTAELPPYDRDFIGFYGGNGIIADRADGLAIRDVTIRRVPGFAVIVARTKGVTIERVLVEDSGSLNARRRNNTSGGILLEEGTADFTVRDCTLRRIRGNGIWTHSLYTSARNGPGLIAGNHFEEIGRDALQAGHATALRIEKNTGTRIGWPVEIVDVEGGGTPVAIDTAGNVDRSTYAGNRFEEINGKCIDLDGFHNGEVRDNVCVNKGSAADYPFGHYGIVFNNTNPDMQSSGVVVSGNIIDGTKFGGIFVIGHGNTIRGNTLTRINLAKCGCPYDPQQPDLLRAGIYLGSKAERAAPSRDNTVIGNRISGYGMDRYCVVTAPGVNAAQQKAIEENECSSP